MDHYHRGGNLFSLVLCMILHAVYTEHVISICWLLTRGKNWCCVILRIDDLEISDRGVTACKKVNDNEFQ